jgi:type IV pilus assembly protein PilM
MFFSKKYHLTGLDIGSGTLKAAEVVEGKKGRLLKQFAIQDLPPGVIEDGIIRDRDTASGALRELFRANDLKEKNVAISIGGYSVIVKKINVQNMTEDDLQDTIQLEAEQYIPFDISDVNLDFQILGENPHNANQMEVLLVAAKKEMIEDYVNLVQLAGLNPCVIDVDAFALQNIFEICYEPAEESVALIDIGASKTSLNILKDNASVFMRDVSLGCAQINQKIASLVGCEPAEAEQIKKSDQSAQISSEDLRQIISSVVADWCSEIRRALDFFYSTYPEDQIKRVVLSGGGANIREFRELLAAETSAEVETIHPFSGFQLSDRIDTSFLETVSPQAAICMGLAIRKVDDK